MDPIDLFDRVILYIENTEIMRAEEFSYGESLAQLIEAEKMPPIYFLAIEYRKNLRLIEAEIERKQI